MGIAKILTSTATVALIGLAAPALAGGPDAATAEPTTTEAAPAADAMASTEITAGTAVVDKNGEAIGTIEKVEGNLATVASGETKVRVPLESFAKSEKGAMLAMTRTEFEAAAKAAQPS